MHAGSFVPSIVTCLQAYYCAGSAGVPPNDTQMIPVAWIATDRAFSLQNKDGRDNPDPTVERLFDAAEPVFRIISIHDIDFFSG